MNLCQKLYNIQDGKSYKEEYINQTAFKNNLNKWHEERINIFKELNRIHKKELAEHLNSREYCKTLTEKIEKTTQEIIYLKVTQHHC